jgi:hypothetical protein
MTSNSAYALYTMPPCSEFRAVTDRYGNVVSHVTRPLGSTEPPRAGASRCKSVRSRANPTQCESVLDSNARHAGKHWGYSGTGKLYMWESYEEDWDDGQPSSVPG